MYTNVAELEGWNIVSFYGVCQPPKPELELDFYDSLPSGCIEKHCAYFYIKNIYHHKQNKALLYFKIIIIIKIGLNTTIYYLFP